MQTACRAVPVLLAAIACACSSAPSSHAVNPPDAGADSARDDAAPSDGGRPHDGAMSADAPAVDGGALKVSCGYDTPTLVVTRSSGGGPATTLLRLPLQFSGAASGITISSVTQRAADSGMTTIRDWKVASLVPPAGFAGSVAPSSGYPNPTVLFTATAGALTSETDACAQKPWDRPGGTIHVSGTTKEAGGFEVDCGYGLSFGGNGAEPLRFACATGTPGWLGGQGSESPGITYVTSPIEAVLAAAGVHAYGAASAPVTGFTVTGATLTAHVSAIVPPGVMCPMTDPAPWTLTGGMSTLWNGPDSSHVWSGPVTPGQQADANWFYQLSGAMPMSGYCVPASVDPMSCPPPVDQAVITGMSSAGPFAWESDLFNCILM